MSASIASGRETMKNSDKYEEYKSEYEGLKIENAKGKAPRKLQVKCLEVKYKALKELEKGNKSKSKIAKSYGIPANTLSDWIKSKDKIIAACESPLFKKGCKRMRLAKYSAVEAALYDWYKGARENGIYVTGSMLKSRALGFAAKRGATDFTGSTGWLTYFKEKYNIFLTKPFIEEECEVEKLQQEEENDESNLEDSSKKSIPSNTEPDLYIPNEPIKPSFSKGEATRASFRKVNKTAETGYDVTDSLSRYICCKHENIAEEKSSPNESENKDSEVNEMKPQIIHSQSLLRVEKMNIVSQKFRESGPAIEHLQSTNPSGITPTEVLEMCGKIRLFLLTNHVPQKIEGLNHVSGLELIISKLTLPENLC